MNPKKNLDNVLIKAMQSITEAQDINTLEKIRIEYLGKNGILTKLIKQLSNVPHEQRSKIGNILNKAKKNIQDTLKIKKNKIEEIVLKQKLELSSIDVTIPGGQLLNGGIHPLTNIMDKIEQYFISLNYQIIYGPEIEDTYHNFEALNIPKNHPARAMHDTFYFNENILLRTHTSSMQIRMMKSQIPPIRIICPGKVYRCDSDLTHSPMFHQLEGVFIDKNINFSFLKKTVEDFISFFFETPIKIRFRPSYFPFTEPSAEVDIQCIICNGNGCKICKNTNWVEIIGCGMVHPNVLHSGGINYSKYQGFAFGMGIERLAMIYYKIHDVRYFYENDLKFLGQFKSPIH